MKKSFVILISCVLSFMFFGCLANIEKKPEKYPKEACQKMPGKKVIAAINDNCVSCHKTDFNTPKKICQYRKRIISSVLEGRMPKMGTLYPHYKTTLTRW